MIRRQQSPSRNPHSNPRIQQKKSDHRSAGEGSRRVRHGDIFTAGSIVRESGVYEVLHDGEHRPVHEVVMVAKDLFPPCDQCNANVKYRVVRTAPYIFSDEDFQEPSN